MSNNCKEFTLDDLTAITAVPVADYSPGAAAWQVEPTIGAAYFPSSFAHTVTIGQKAAFTGGALIPIIRSTGKVTDDEADTVSGRLHTVKATCEADTRDAAVWGRLLTLERTPSHLLLTYRDGTRAFVQATKDSYQCTVNRDGSKASVTLRVQNMMGAQQIV